jgi:hypothetical protein
MDHFDQHQILCDEKHGFRAQRSCETQLISTLKRIARNMDQGCQTNIILLNFSKTLDKGSFTNDYCLRCSTMESGAQHYAGYKISWETWIQSVTLNGHTSPALDVLSRVPQGTVLGPLLYLAYIKSMAFLTALHDCLVYRKIRNQQDAATKTTGVDVQDLPQPSRHQSSGLPNTWRQKNTRKAPLPSTQNQQGNLQELVLSEDSERLE